MQFTVVFPEPLKVHCVLVSERLLGKGKFFVYHVKTNFSSFGRDFAMKVFPRKDGRPSHLYRRERKFLSSLTHPHIIKYFPVIKHDFSQDFLLTEYTRNGNFNHFIGHTGISNEKIIRTYLHQLIEGVSYLHNQGVAHLDLKLDNLVLDNNFCLKIVDFDCAEFIEDQQLKTPGGGTSGYRPPELINNNKSKDFKKRDMYACGIILYIWKTSELPFEENNCEKVQKSSTYEMFKNENEMFWKAKARKLGITFSQEFKELLNGLWEESIERRFGIEDVKRSIWFNQEVYSCKELKDEILTNGF